MTPVVWLVQEPLRRVGDRLAPAHDTGAAEAYGQRRTVIGQGAKPWMPGKVMPDIEAMLAEYDPQRDYLLLIGSPVFIGMVFAGALDKAAAFEVPSVRLLYYRTRERDYTEIIVNVDGLNGVEYPSPAVYPGADAEEAVV